MSSKSYSESEMLKKLESEMSSIHKLYKQKVCNWTGKTSDSSRYYTEIAASYLLDNIDVLDSIKCIPRKKSYFCGHQRTDKSMTNRVEEYVAKELLKIKWDIIGEVLDIQIPLKNKNDEENKGRGKIDLVSLLDDGNLLMIELKRQGCSDTLLGCALEIETYYRQIDRNKFVKDFSDNCANVGDTAQVKKAIMIAKGSDPHNELLANHPNVTKLINKLNIRVIVYDYTINPNIRVVEEATY